MKNIKAFNENLSNIQEYPCIVEVSQNEDFSNDPYMKSNKVQVCLCKIDGKYACIETKEGHAQWMLDQIKQAIKSGSISGLTLGFWNYARKYNNYRREGNKFIKNKL